MSVVEYREYSVLMSVYHKEKPEYLKQSIESIQAQTLSTNDFVLVCDGPLNEQLDSVIATKRQEMGESLNVVRLAKNGGLGNALNEGIKHCKNELVARMDSDDIAVRNRFELQLAYLMSHPNTDILGGQIEEFIGEITNVAGRRIVPLTDANCKAYLKKRCPFNHMSVMYKKEAVLKAGNYRDWFYNEDYYLWVRMALDKCVFANLPEVLVQVRVGKEMYARRGGGKYFRSEEKIQRLMLQNGLISVPRYLVNVGERLIIQVLMPNTLRGWVLRKFARK